MYTFRLRTAEDVCIVHKRWTPTLQPPRTSIGGASRVHYVRLLVHLETAVQETKKKLVPNSSQTETPNLPSLKSTKSVMMRSGVPSTMSDFVGVRLPGTVCLREEKWVSHQLEHRESNPGRGSRQMLDQRSRWCTPTMSDLLAIWRGL